ncbi:MAG: ribonuclease P protein component [Candidatus Komeilibacteria bacterium]
MKNSLSQDKDILRVLRQRPFFSPYFTVKVANNSEKTYRYTIIISKKVHKLAAKRNQIKRRIRAIINGSQKKIRICDFVISVRKQIYNIEPQQQREEIRKILLKSKILNV